MPMTPFGIMSLASKFQESRIFLTAAEMDVFTLLATKPMSAQEIAERLEATVRGVTILLDAVESMGLLEKNEDKYLCPAEVASIMSKESPTSITSMVRVATGGWKRWSDLTDIVRRGNRIRGTAFDFKESEQEPFTDAMYTIAYEMAPSIVAAINPSGLGNYSTSAAVPAHIHKLFSKPRPA